MVTLTITIADITKEQVVAYEKDNNINLSEFMAKMITQVVQKNTKTSTPFILDEVFGKYHQDIANDVDSSIEAMDGSVARYFSQEYQVAP